MNVEPPDRMIQQETIEEQRVRLERQINANIEVGKYDVEYKTKAHELEGLLVRDSKIGGDGPWKAKQVDKDDSINSPKHYNIGKIEVITAIEDWKLTYHLGNAVKYIARAGRKDPAKYAEDLRKAVWYVNRAIEIADADNQGRPAIQPNDMGKKQ